MLRPDSNDTICREELERFRGLQLYADRMLIQQRRYAAAARNLHARATRSFWLKSSFGALLLFKAVAAFVHYGEDPSNHVLIEGILLGAFGLDFALHSAFVMARTGELSRFIGRLAPEEKELAGDPVTA